MNAMNHIYRLLVGGHIRLSLLAVALIAAVLFVMAIVIVIMFWRNHKIKASLYQELQRNKAELQGKERKIKSLKDSKEAALANLHNSKVELQGKEREIKSLREEKKTALVNLHTTKVRLETCQKQEEQLTLELKNVTEEMEFMKKNVLSTEKVLTQKEKQLKSCENKLLETEKKVEKLEAEKKKISSMLNRVQLQENEMTGALNNAKRENEELKQQISVIEGALRQKDELLNSEAKLLKEKEVELISLKREEAKTRSQLQRATTRLEATTQELNSAKEAVSTMNRKINKSKTQLSPHDSESIIERLANW